MTKAARDRTRCHRRAVARYAAGLVRGRDPRRCLCEIHSASRACTATRSTRPPGRRRPQARGARRDSRCGTRSRRQPRRGLGVGPRALAPSRRGDRSRGRDPRCATRFDDDEHAPASRDTAGPRRDPRRRQRDPLVRLAVLPGPSVRPYVTRHERIAGADRARPGRRARSMETRSRHEQSRDRARG